MSQYREIKTPTKEETIREKLDKAQEVTAMAEEMNLEYRVEDLRTEYQTLLDLKTPSMQDAERMHQIGMEFCSITVDMIQAQIDAKEVAHEA